MKKIITLVYIILLVSISNVKADQSDCSELDKLSKDYTKCIAEKAKDKGKEIKEKVTSEETKNTISKFGSKLKKSFNKFKNSKTLKEFNQK